jgi:3-deoxy-D-manno-octulosonic-acid transferase
MGEFEQAKPLVKALKEQFSGCLVVVSVFSPSAYENIEGYRDADIVCYLPFDSRKKAGRFLDLIKPDVALIVRHDIWPNHLYAMKKRGVPVVLVNSSVRPHPFQKSWLMTQINRFLFTPFSHILTVSPEACEFYQSLGMGQTRIEVIGDTRYDQVVHRAKESETVVAPLRRIKGNRPCFVMGSTWPGDEEVLFPAIRRFYGEKMDLFSVIVPHEPTLDHLQEIEQALEEISLKSVRFSEIKKSGSGKCQVLLVDRVGILASLYALGEVTFVGGGFGPGVHSVLEPAAQGKVVLYGPRHENSYEAGQLIKRGVGFSVEDSEAIYEKLRLFLKNKQHRSERGNAAGSLVQENVGATRRVVNRVQGILTEK